jgi:hypothetical protein
MGKGLKDLKWWAETHNELQEPSGGWEETVNLKARWSVFGRPNQTGVSGRKSVCGAKLKELSGPVECGSYNTRRWMICEVCGWKGDRELGRVVLPENVE